MRKIKYLIIIFLLLVLPIKVFAAGSINVSTGSLSIKKGTTATFTITASNAAGKINISSSNTAVATVSSSSEFLDMQSTTITVTGIAVGTSTITIYNADVTTYDDEDITGKSKTISVNVYEETTNNNNTNTNTNNNNNNNNTQRQVISYSTNNKLKSISIEGYELEKVDNNNYKLNVKNNVTSIIINAEAEDSKAKVSGTGEHTIDIGDNTFEVIVTSESGAQNKIKIIVNRKDGYYIDDIDDALSSDENEISIILEENNTVTKEVLTKIKKSGKTVTLNRFDESKNLLYSWTIDGSNISNETDFNSNVTFVSNNSNKINKLSNYASGKYINFEHNGTLPKGTKVKINVSDKYINNDKLNVYYYNEKDNKLELISSDILVNNGYIELELEHASEYFITMSNINIKSKKETNYLSIILIVETVILALIIVLDIIGKNPISKKSKNDMQI